MGWWQSLFGKPQGILEFDGDGTFEWEVVGESNYQAALAGICGGKTEDGHNYECQASLVPEPTNPHDPNAVRVTIGGLVVGYLRKPDAIRMNAAIRRARASRAQASAIIVGGWSGRKGKRSEGHFGVRLDIDL